MKKLLKTVLALSCALGITSCKGQETLIVYTESGFAPFEYVSNGKIVGVDVDIMEKVGEKLGKKIVFENVNFDVIVDAVSEGKLTNVGAAGLSINESRKEKVDFSNVYYQANLYVIYQKSVEDQISKIMTDSNKGVYWSSLTTQKGIAVQTGTTADLFLNDEIAEGGSLQDVNVNNFASLDVAISDIGLNSDYLIIDELPAKKLVEGKDNLACLPLYYEGEEGCDDELSFDEYAICVTKGQDQLLNAINEVLDELLNSKDENGVNGIQALVNKHLGISK